MPQQHNVRKVRLRKLQNGELIRCPDIDDKYGFFVPHCRKECKKFGGYSTDKDGVRFVLCKQRR